MYECRHGAAHEVRCAALGRALHEALPEDAPDEPERWGRSWTDLSLVPIVSNADVEALEELDAPREARAHLETNHFYVSHEQWQRFFGDAPPHECSCVTLDDGRVLVPNRWAPRRPRAHFDAVAWNGFGATGVAHLSYVRVRVHVFQRSDAAAGDGAVLTHAALRDVLDARIADAAAAQEAGAVAAVELLDDDFARAGVAPPKAATTVALSDGSYAVLARTRERFFRVHTGRTWRDCATPHVDRIFACQKLGHHDIFFLLGVLGRLLYQVGELDNYEITVFLQGIGGCGKSTMMKLVQELFAPHHRGIMSSNQQPQFGMSALVGKKGPIFCNEVAHDLQVKQEEWQTSVSGEIGSYAVKNKEPIVTRITSQHFWIGNNFPETFNDEQGQVTRRLAGLFFNYEVLPRDTSVLGLMLAQIGEFHRRINLAYHEWVRQYGTTDPMSSEALLPEHFVAFRAALPAQDQPVRGLSHRQGVRRGRRARRGARAQAQGDLRSTASRRTCSAT